MSTELKFLSALVDHATHRGLGDALTHISPPHYNGTIGEVQPFPYGGSDLALLLRWAVTLTGPAVTVSAVIEDPESVHLVARGALTSGVPVKVAVVVVDGAELDLLRTNTVVEVGAPVDVDLLRRLTSALAAEAEGVPAGTAVSSS
jgi:hypothetical protein